MQGTITVTYDLPTVSARQWPIRGTRISFRVTGASSWTFQDEVPADAAEQALEFFDMAEGAYDFQAIVVDDHGVEGQPVEKIGVDVVFTRDAPGQVSNFVISFV